MESVYKVELEVQFYGAFLLKNYFFLAVEKDKTSC